MSLLLGGSRDRRDASMNCSSTSLASLSVFLLFTVRNPAHGCTDPSLGIGNNTLSDIATRIRRWSNGRPRSLRTTPVRGTLRIDLRPRRRVDKGPHDFHAIKALIKSAGDLFLRRRAPYISIEPPNLTETIVFLLPCVITCICRILGRVIERRFRIDHLDPVERLDR